MYHCVKLNIILGNFSLNEEPCDAQVSGYNRFQKEINFINEPNSLKLLSILFLGVLISNIHYHNINLRFV